jgi:hypothetical protein
MFWSIGQRRHCIKYLLVFVHLVNGNTHELRKSWYLEEASTVARRLSMQASTLGFWCWTDPKTCRLSSSRLLYSELASPRG